MDLGRRADVAVGTDDAVPCLSVTLDDDVAAQDRVGPNGGAGVYARVVADIGWTSHVLERVKVDAVSEEDPVLQLDARDGRSDRAIEEVTVGREILRKAADVLPVSLGDIAVEWRPGVEQLGKEIATEVVGFRLGDVGEHRWVEHVDARC